MEVGVDGRGVGVAATRPDVGEPHPARHEVFCGDGEVARLCRAIDWSTTPLGPIEQWPAALRTTVRTMLESPFAASLWCGPELTLLYNDGYRRALGAKHPAALGRTGREVWAEIWTEVEPLFTSIRDGGPSVHAEDARFVMERAERVDGQAAPPEEAWFTFALSPVRDDDGAIIAILNIVTETTARVREETFRERLLHSMTDGFAAFDREWRYTFVNAEAERLLGRSRNELLGRVVWEVFPEAVHGMPWTGAHAARDEQRMVEYEFRLGAIGKWLLARNYPLPEGGVAVIFRDITAERERDAERDRLLAAERAAREQADERREHLKAVLAQLPVGVVIVEAPSGRVVTVNEAIGRIWRDERPHTEDMSRYSAEWVGYHPDGRRIESHEWPIARALLHGETMVGWPCEIERADGERARIEISATPVRMASGAIEAAVAVVVDVTDRVAAERERERLLARSEALVVEAEAARVEAESANRAKSQFLAVMSHELRTPLNAIGGYAELLEMGIRGPVTAPQVEDLRRIQSSQRHLLGLINEVLNYAKLETGAVRFDVADVCVRDAMAAAEGLVEPQARARGLVLVTERPPATLLARADVEKLRQILVNLLSNAVKFTDPGGEVVLAAEAVGERVAITVRDTGIGIPADKLEAIFEPFVQVRGELTRTAEGTGLGLAISRDLARGMGGELTVRSTPGSGSTFTLTLPAA